MLEKWSKLYDLPWESLTTVILLLLGEWSLERVEAWRLIIKYTASKLKLGLCSYNC